MRLSRLLFPQAPQVRVHDILSGDQTLFIFASTQGAARCPRCRHRSTHLHSHYERTLADVACGGCAVTIALRVRRFRCLRERCPCRIFGERLPHLASPRGQRTLRAQVQLLDLGFALGGRPGVRAARRLGLRVSVRTLLRLLRRQPLPTVAPVRVLGVDDFALRKGRRYGTILVNLETHTVIDLLPDRTAATLAAWLRHHPEIAIISRDRAGAYADGARQGASQARQVADRFHLLKNVTEALERFLARHHVALRQAARSAGVPASAGEADPATLPSPPGQTTNAQAQTSAADPPLPAAAAASSGRHEQLRQDRRARRLARYEEVQVLHAQGKSIRTIAAATGLAPRTVLRFVHADSFPEQGPRARRRSIVSPFLPYLHERWQAGCHNARRLWQEICQRGFTGGHTVVADVLRTWRERSPACQHLPATADAPPAVLDISCAPRHICWLLLRPWDSLTDEERAYLTRLYHLCPQVALAEALVEEFATVLREQDVPGWYAWLHGLDLTGIPELQAIARGMWLDRQAIEAAVSLDWSNGQVEGSVNRLKTIKRAMYGRANFDLLKQRVLHAA
jgi:transposase